MNFINHSQNFAKAILTDFANKLFAEKGKSKKEGKAEKVKLTLEEMNDFIASFVGKPMAVSAEGKPVSLKKNGKPRKQSRWQKFLSVHKGEGLNKEELKNLYAEEKKTMSGSDSDSDSKPKRVNGYNLFVKRNSAEMKESNPGSELSIFALLGSAWKDMSDEDKAVYKKEAAELNGANFPKKEEEKPVKKPKKSKKSKKKAKKAKKSEKENVVTSGSEEENEEKKTLPTVTEEELDDTLPNSTSIDLNAHNSDDLDVDPILNTEEVDSDDEESD